jgi:hypothetical protein
MTTIPTWPHTIFSCLGFQELEVSGEQIGWDFFFLPHYVILYNAPDILSHIYYSSVNVLEVQPDNRAHFGP